MGAHEVNPRGIFIMLTMVLGAPSLNLQNLSTFGVITLQRNDPRRIRFGARIEF